MSPEDLFTVVVDHLAGLSSFPVIVESSGSFEQWINWEAYVACRNAGWTTVPNPRYVNPGLSGGPQFGDLLVERPDGWSIMLETKIVGDYTLPRYLGEIEADRDKLAGLKEATDGRIRGLQLLFLSSMKGNILGRPSWTDWLEKLSFWKARPWVTRDIVVGEGGEALFRGWAI